MSESSDSGAAFKFEIKDAPNAEATPIGTSPDGVKDETGNPPLQVYRFKLRTKDGVTQPAAIAVSQDPLEVSDLRWDSQEFDHGTETVLHAKVANDDGREVRFVVEHNHDGWWKPFATVPAKVEKGEATATLLVHHPVLPPTGAEPAASELQKAKDAQLRFYVERGPAEPQKKADPDPQVTPSTQPKEKTPPRFAAFDLRWETEQFEHGTETMLHAAVANADGKQVRFVVEYQEGSDWKPLATVPATVEQGEATAKLLVHHPILPPTGPDPDPRDLAQAKDAQLRFSVEEGPAEPQKRAESAPVKASTTPKAGS